MVRKLKFIIATASHWRQPLELLNLHINSSLLTILMSRITIIGTIFIASITSGCGNNRYSINEEYIEGISKNDGFSIAELKGDRSSGEKLRVCCEAISDNLNLTDKVFFHKKNPGYQWSFCTPDLRFVENDSLMKLSVEEKLEIIKNENNEKSGSKYYNTFPLTFKRETWYHLFGLEDTEGSYFVYVEKDGSFKVEYFEGGPF